MAVSPQEKKDLRKFGLTVAAGFALLALLGFLRHKHTLVEVCGVASFALTAFALVAPALLGPVRVVWMRIGAVLGFINMRILLALIFYGVLTPAGFVARLFGYDPLQRRFDKKQASYWVAPDHEHADATRYERQF